MEKADVVIVGGSAAGITAAVTVRRHYPDRSILLATREEQVPIPCGIPYLFGSVPSADKNLIPVRQILEKNTVSGLIDEITELDCANHRVVTAANKEIEYRRLILATGSVPIVPPIPGADLDGVFAIRKSVPALQKIIDRLKEASDLAIVGCGFIGVEIAEECRRRRKDLTIRIVEMLQHCLQLVYDKDFCVTAEETLEAQNIELLLDEKVECLQGDETVQSIQLTSGKEVKADMVIMGIGAVANVTLAQKAGLDIGHAKGIEVNRYMQTSDPDIFACGDCAEKVSFFDGKPSQLKLASIATMEARIAGANVFGTRRANMGAIGVYSTVLGDRTYAAAGLTQAEAKKNGYTIGVGEAESINRHPGCMPGGTNLKVRLVFERAGQVLLGGQVTGARSGGELINVISACISQRMTADDIAMFQTGTHPALTASPIAYQLVNAAEMAIGEMSKHA